MQQRLQGYCAYAVLVAFLPRRADGVSSTSTNTSEASLFRYGIVGCGAVGARVARQLLATAPNAEVVLSDVDAEVVRDLAQSLGPKAYALTEGDVVDQGVDVVVVAAPCGRHLGPVRDALRRGVPVVSTSDRLEDVEALVALDDLAKRNSTPALVGVAFAPGLSCVLARFVGQSFDVVDEVHVAKQGTGGPACAREHHRALSGSAKDWRDGGWIRRPGGSGRELVWFPEPIGGSDCYRAALPDAWLLRPAFGSSERVTARMAASRQDRFTSWLPMLTPPHPEGAVGAIRVEVRGRVNGERVIEVAGAVERPAVGAAAVVAAAVDLLVGSSPPEPGARGLATAVDARGFLRSVASRGVRAQRFAGLDDD